MEADSDKGTFSQNVVPELSTEGPVGLKVKVKVAQSCPTLCDPMDYTGVDSLFPSPGDLPNLGVEPKSPSLQAGSFTS